MLLVLNNYLLKYKFAKEPSTGIKKSKHISIKAIA